MNEEHHLSGMEKQIFPVIRATSFDSETKSGIKLVTNDHTAETRIYYALDLGKSYRLIEDNMLKNEQWTKERIDEIETFNLRYLAIDINTVRDDNNDIH